MMAAKGSSKPEESLTKSLNKDVQQIKDIVTDLVAPQYRQNINIIPEHVTVLHGKKTKNKQKSKNLKKSSKQKQIKPQLSRKEKKKLGLYHIPTRSIKYDDCLPLHELWKGYIKEHLHLEEHFNIPQVTDSGYDAFSKLLVKIDLHGAKLEVIQSRCPSFIGLKGIVILDTKNTLKIVGEDNRTRTIPKSDCIFVSKFFGNLELQIFGKQFTIRPAERSVKKIKSFIDLEI